MAKGFVSEAQSNQKIIEETFKKGFPTQEEVAEFLNLGQNYQNILHDNEIDLHDLHSLSDFIFEA